MARLYVGSYILDSADTSSSSTTSGVQLDLDWEDPLSPEIEDQPDGAGSDYRWPLFYAIVTAANEGALKTAVDAVRAAVENCSGKTITYEETNGTTLFTMASTDWPQCTGRCVVEQGQLTAEIAFSFIGRRAGTAGTGAADAQGQVGPITWEYERSPGGLAGMIVRAVFKATSGTGARANAVTWINAITNPSNYATKAPWLNSAFRALSPIVEFDQSANLATVAETSYDPARVTLTFRELHSTLAADAAWPTQALSGNWNVGLTERGAMNERAGSEAGFDVTLFGDVTLKSQGNTTFNSSETKLTDAELYANGLAAVNVIISHFRTVYAFMQLIQMGQATINIDAVQGVAGFTVRFLGGTNVLEWEEHCTVKNVQAKVRSRSTDGSHWKYEMAGGPDRICRHTLRMVALTPLPYRAPSLNTNWDEDEAELEPTITLKHNNGQVEYHTFGSKQWTYMNSGPTGGQGYTSTLIPRTIDAIGDGLI